MASPLSLFPPHKVEESVRTYLVGIEVLRVHPRDEREWSLFQPLSDFLAAVAQAGFWLGFSSR